MHGLTVKLFELHLHTTSSILGRVMQTYTTSTLLNSIVLFTFHSHLAGF